MALHLLTVRAIQAASDGDHSDGGGLLLRVRGASASWVLRFTAQTGRRREMGLGTVRRGSAAQAGDSVTGARKLAREARELLQMGVDPIDERDSRRAAARAVEEQQAKASERDSMTLARAARDYHQRVIEPTATTLHAAHWIASLENHVPPSIWHAPIAGIEPPALLAGLSAVRALDDRTQRVPETLQRVRQRLDAIFEDAIFHGWCTSNPASAIRRKLTEAHGKRERSQFAALPYDHAPAFMRRLRAEEGIAARCFEFAVLTASRTNEVLAAAWPEFDLDAAIWRIPGERMKAGEPHTVHLSARALELVKGQLGFSEKLVFPSPMRGGKPMSNMAMLAVLDRMGARQLTTVHGLCRATFSTWAYETGAARPDVIEACLAHREADRIKAAYNRAQFTAERRQLLDAWAAYLAAAPPSPALRDAASGSEKSVASDDTYV